MVHQDGGVAPMLLFSLFIRIPPLRGSRLQNPYSLFAWAHMVIYNGLIAKISHLTQQRQPIASLGPNFSPTQKIHNFSQPQPRELNIRLCRREVVFTS
ncbi:hypothetical protein HDV62DRAFT_200042 [Trichoderma sp. SZMC 28011]